MSDKDTTKPARGTDASAPLSPLSAHQLGTSPRPRGRSADHASTRDHMLDVFIESPTMAPLSRRPTFDSTRRTVSPPNSVKAFAQARRRGQEARQDSDNEDDDDDDDGGDFSADKPPLGSGRSCHSRSHNTCGHRNSLGLATTEVEGSHRGPHKDRLYIDFDYLETLINAEDGERPVSADFANLPDSAMPNNAPMFTADGDFIDVATDHHSISEEKGGDAKSGPIQISQQYPEQSRFNFFSSALESTIHAAEFGDLILPGENIRSLFDFPDEEPDGVWWLNMNNPTGGEVWTICKAFGIHPLTIEDIIHKESREKIELFPSYYFACFRSFASVEEPDGVDYHPFNVYVVVFREGIISFSFTPNSHASRVRFRISQLKEQVSISSDWICYALIDDIVDSFGPGINQIEHEADAIEDQVFITRPEDNQLFLRRIGLTRKNVMSLMRLLGGKADVLRAFTKRCTEDYDVTPRMDIALYLSDIQDHAVTMMNSLIHFDTMLSRSHSNYLAQLSIDNIDMGNRTNEFLSRVTVIATVIVPLNVVCGLFGMNVKVPWGDVENLNAFFGIMSGIILFAAVSLGVARRMGYF
ncbi:putative CorA family metal ion transporter [Colletotrichum karsti]|uniref:CorA family metal ion transporter n=1 Tax=Colletotrichum karsti TaxID=1095194 RepID=A0A9P6I1H9_9PEZI|nr:putative CorA family metal ion transporter [Colletotrichum karsti]KAF9873131.1 putative CorA family metal ion transporter [Colletotrichum karsti]